MPQLVQRPKASITNAVLASDPSMSNAQTGFSPNLGFKNAAPVAPVKNKPTSNKQAYVAAVNNGAKTKDQSLTDSVLKSSKQAVDNLKLQVGLTDFSYKNQANMDKVATELTDQELVSNEGIGILKNLFPGVQDTNKLIGLIRRRKSGIEQLRQLPYGTKLPDDQVRMLEEAGITNPSQYMSLKPKNAIANGVAGAANFASSVLMDVGRGGGGGPALVGAAKAEDAQAAAKSESEKLLFEQQKEDDLNARTDKTLASQQVMQDKKDARAQQHDDMMLQAVTAKQEAAKTSKSTLTAAQKGVEEDRLFKKVESAIGGKSRTGNTVTELINGAAFADYITTGKKGGLFDEPPTIKKITDPKGNVIAEITNQNGVRDAALIERFIRATSGGKVTEGNLNLLKDAVPTLAKVGIKITHFADGSILTPTMRKSMANVLGQLAEEAKPRFTGAMVSALTEAADKGLNPNAAGITRDRLVGLLNLSIKDPIYMSSPEEADRLGMLKGTRFKLPNGQIGVIE